jgi:glycerophosphoryl diester phosphodiesterase
MTENKNCLFIAHRGESFDAPENTLAAVKLAWQRDVDAVEIDIRLSRDNKIVVIHDLNTFWNGRKNKFVRSQTLEELKQLNVGNGEGRYPQREKIPTLQEIFETVPAGKKLILEIKCGHEIIKYLCSDIFNSGLKMEQVEIVGSDLNVLAQVKKKLIEHLVGFDYAWFRKALPIPVYLLIQKVKKHNLNGLNFLSFNLLNEKQVNKVKSAGLKLYVWTVNNPLKARKLVDWGVDGIITDRAQWLKQQVINSNPK